MKRAAYIAVAITLLTLVGYSPVTLSNMTFSALYSVCSILYDTLYSSSPSDTNSLKASILNVTTDFNELSMLLQEFFKTSSVDHSLEESFKQFLADKAVRSHAHFERSIDWILSLFKIVFPFLFISILGKVFSRNENDSSSIDQQLQLVAGRKSPSVQRREEDDEEDEEEQVARAAGVIVSKRYRPSSSSSRRIFRGGSESPVAGPSTPTEESGMLGFSQRGASNLGKQHVIHAKPY